MDETPTEIRLANRARVLKRRLAAMLGEEVDLAQCREWISSICGSPDDEHVSLKVASTNLVFDEDLSDIEVQTRREAQAQSLAFDFDLDVEVARRLVNGIRPTSREVLSEDSDEAQNSDQKVFSVSLEDLKQIKNQLRRDLFPEVKSSHLGEAVAAMCGFRTHMGMVAAFSANGGQNLLVRLAPEQFEARLNAVAPISDATRIRRIDVADLLAAAIAYSQY